MPHVHSPARANARRLVAVLGLSAVILVIELVGGLASNSLALLADAGHVFTDIAGISLALLAIWIGLARLGHDPRRLTSVSSGRPPTVE